MRSGASIFYSNNKLSLIYRSMSRGSQILEIANGDRTVWLIIRLFGSPEHLQFTSGSTIGSTSPLGSFLLLPLSSLPLYLHPFPSSSLFLSLSTFFVLHFSFWSFFFHPCSIPLTRQYHLPISRERFCVSFSRNCRHPLDESTNPR